MSLSFLNFRMAKVSAKYEFLEEALHRVASQLVIISIKDHIQSLLEFITLIGACSSFLALDLIFILFFFLFLFLWLFNLSTYWDILFFVKVFYDSTYKLSVQILHELDILGSSVAKL